MLDDHLGLPAAQHDWRGAAARATNQSNGQAFHGIQRRYRTSTERLMGWLLIAAGLALFWSYLVWAAHSNFSHLS